MLAATHLIGFAAGRGTDNLYDAIAGLGLGANLQLCLDAGDLASYDGASQTWNDRSGGGYNFYRGTTSGGEASDPAFNGPPGDPNSAYFSFDGGDLFTYTTTNAAWMDALHKSGAAFSLFALYFVPSSGLATVLGTNNGSSGTVGLFYEIAEAAATTTLNVSKGVPGTPALQVIADGIPNRNAWNGIGLSINNGPGSFFWQNGGYNTVSSSNTFNSNYNTPSASGASNPLQLMSYGGSAGPPASGSRLMCMAIWSSALSKAELDALWASQRQRVGV
jgi:hypothetical protein